MKVKCLILFIAIITLTITISAGDADLRENPHFQQEKYAEFVGVYELPQFGPVSVIKKDGKLFGGPAGRELELVPVKNEPSKFEIYRGGSLFAQFNFVKEGEKVFLEVTMRGNTLRAAKQEEKSKEKFKVLKSVTLIDGRGGQPVPNVSIVLQKNKIVDIIRGNEKALPENSEILDLNGKFVIPGLIDSHTHLATDPSDRDNRTRIEGMLEHNLYGGVVAMRDMGGDARALADLARNANLDEIQAPNLYYSAVFGGPSFFSDRRTVASGRGVIPGKVPWLLGVTEETNMPLAIAEAKGTGATGIKIYTALPQKEVDRITKEAHRQGMKVWAHVAILPALPLDGIEAGIDSISHADMFVTQQFGRRPNSKDREIILEGKFSPDKAIMNEIWKKMIEKEVILDATLSVYSNFPAERKEVFNLAKEIVRRAHRAGVQISAGTDNFVNFNNEPFPPLYLEMRLLAESGLSTLDVIKAATLISAKTIGIEKTHGTVEVGKTANLVILNKDPSKDLKNLETIQLIIKNGKEFKRKDFVEKMGYQSSKKVN